MKAITYLFPAILIFLTAHAADAQNLGDLTDPQPNPLEVQGSLTRSQNQFTYTFTLTEARVVNILLTGLSNNANLGLLDSSLTTLASSSNKGVADENIEMSLNPPGPYSIVIQKPGQKKVSYTLRVGAQPGGGGGGGGFKPQDDVVSGTTSIQDPEYAFLPPMTSHVAWRTNARLIIAPVNPATGDFLLNQAVDPVDTGLAVYNDVVNGPEWSLSQAGARVLYTKVANGRWHVAQAQFVDPPGSPPGSWVPSKVTGTDDGFKPFGNTDPGDGLPLVVYTLGTRANRNQGNAWKALNSSVGAVIPNSVNLVAGRWVPGGGSIVFSQLEGVVQLVNYNITSGVTTTLTGPDNINKALPFAVRAPDLAGTPGFVDNVVITVSETDDNTRGSFKWIGVYRQEVGGTWKRIKQIFSPSAELPAVHSVEPFVFGNKTYVSFLAVKDPQTNPDQRKLGAAVFIARVSDNFVREVSAPSETMVRSDPEPFATNQAAFIYYTELDNGFRRIHRCATGLAP